MPEVRVGLIGLGTVGSAFAAVLAERRLAIEERFGLRLVLAQVAVARPDVPRRGAEPARVHGEAAELASDPDLDIVAEASGAAGASVWLRAALDRGATVVTANKQAIASDPALLQRLARHDRRLHCEAAAAAALPIVRALRESLAAEEVLSIRGLLNGTTTFVLSRIEEGGTLPQGVAEAQRAGYAEPDPSYDLTGQDAAAKLAILCTLAWREPVGLDRIATRGLDESIPELVRQAWASGRRVRLVAHACRNGDGVEGGSPRGNAGSHGERVGSHGDRVESRDQQAKSRDDRVGSHGDRIESHGKLVGPVCAEVAPAILESSDPLAIGGVESVVEVESSIAGRLLWRAPGAGGRTTASALLADTVSAARVLTEGSPAGERAPYLACGPGSRRPSPTVTGAPG